MIASNDASSSSSAQQSLFMLIPNVWRGLFVFVMVYCAFTAMGQPFHMGEQLATLAACVLIMFEFGVLYDTIYDDDTLFDEHPNLFAVTFPCLYLLAGVCIGWQDFWPLAVIAVVGVQLVFEYQYIYRFLYNGADPFRARKSKQQQQYSNYPLPGKAMLGFAVWINVGSWVGWWCLVQALIAAFTVRMLCVGWRWYKTGQFSEDFRILAPTRGEKDDDGDQSHQEKGEQQEESGGYTACIYAPSENVTDESGYSSPLLGGEEDGVLV